MSRSKKKVTRREAMMAAAAGAATFNPFLSLLEALLKGKAEYLFAQENEYDLDQLYIFLMMTGGAPRWYFDMPIRPNGADDPFEMNPMFINRLTNYEKGNYQGKYQSLCKMVCSSVVSSPKVVTTKGKRPKYFPLEGSPLTTL